MSEDDEATAVFDWMLEIGAIKIHGVRPDGEISYVFTPIFKQMFPEIYESIMGEYNEAVFALWEKDLVSINWVDNDARLWPTTLLFDDSQLEGLTELELDAVYGIRSDYEEIYGPYVGPEEFEG
jgi:hypothetical protein